METEQYKNIQTTKEKKPGNQTILVIGALNVFRSSYKRHSNNFKDEREREREREDKTSAANIIHIH